MFKLKHKLPWILLIAIAMMGLITPKNVSPELRTRAHIIPGFVVFDATSVTGGSDGVVFATTINGVTAPTTTSPASLPYAVRLDIRLVDGAAATGPALTCDSVALIGTNAIGLNVSETVSTITESESLTVNSYESLSSIIGANCLNGADAGDVIRVGVSDHVSLELPLNTTADIVSVCSKDLATGVWTCDESSCTYTQRSQSIDLGACTIAPSDYDLLQIRYRATTRQTRTR